MKRTELISVFFTCQAVLFSAGGFGDHPCNCDRTARFCDVNCCCDDDCSLEEIKVFSRCSNQLIAENKYSCVRESLMFANNSVNVKTVSRGGLFCVQLDNNLASSKLAEPNSIRNESEFQQTKLQNTVARLVRERVNVGTTTGLAEKLPEFYKVGGPVYTVSDGHLSTLKLPVNYFREECSGFSPIAFFNSTRQSCAVTVDHENCATQGQLSASFYCDSVVLKSPKRLRISHLSDKNRQLKEKILELDSDQLLPVACSYGTTTENAATIFGSSIKSNVLRGNVCENVVASVEYRITVNGSAGISSVLVLLSTTSIKLDSAQSRLFQRFSTTFHWLKIPSTSSQSQVNRGYLVGEPLISGRRGENDTEIDDTSMFEKGLTILESGVDDCTTASKLRISIRFGINALSGCRVKLKSNMAAEECRATEERILAALIGSISQKSVASFSSEDSSAWVKRDPCDITVAVDIRITFHDTGHVVQPQPKIVAVEYTYLRANVKIGPREREALVSVTFVDATDRDERHQRQVLAKLPTIEISLPDDFFYPFTGVAPVNFAANSVQQSSLTIAFVTLSVCSFLRLLYLRE